MKEFLQKKINKQKQQQMKPIQNNKNKEIQKETINNCEYDTPPIIGRRDDRARTELGEIFLAFHLKLHVRHWLHVHHLHWTPVIFGL